MTWLMWVLVVIAGLFTYALGGVGLILAGHWIGDRVRFARDRRAMWAELADVTLDPTQGRLP